MLEGPRKHGLAYARIVLGFIVVVHGLANTFGLFGGPGIEQLAQDLSAHVSLTPSVLATIVAVAELLCGLSLLLGPFARVTALVMLVLAVAAILVGGRYQAFFVQDTGCEYLLAVSALCVTVFTQGPGSLVLDLRKLLRKRGQPSREQQ
jgi:putative oxidoreductase